jgi:hypothetical protein
MRRRLLVAVIGAAALASPAAAYGELVVSGPSPALGGGGTTTITIEPGVPAAMLSVLVPRGFSAAIAQQPGTTIGQGSAQLDTGGAVSQAKGSLVALEPAAPVCGASGHAAVWRLSLGAAGELLVAIDAVAATDPDAGYASYRLGVCPAEGTLIESLELRLDGILENPDTAGAFVWHVVATPAGQDGAPDPGAAVESRSTQLVPVRVTLRGVYDRAAGRATLSGLVTAAGETVAGARVRFNAGRPGASLVPSGSATSGSQGRYRKRQLVRRTTVFQASVDVPVQSDPAGCPAPIAPGGCESATFAPLTATSARATVRVPVLRTLRLGSTGADVRRLRADLARLRFLPPGSRGGSFDERTWHAVVALQGWLGLGRTGVVDRRTWRALGRGHVPVPWARIGRGVLIDTARQVMLLVDGGRTVRAIHVSTGAYGRTPRGRFAVYRKEILSWSVPFSTWMPYASYFSGGFAMHAYPSVPTYAASHGCVRVPPVEAPGVYAFAGYGTPVWIR